MDDYRRKPANHESLSKESQGTIDGRLVRLHYSYDGSCDNGENITTTICIEKVVCVASGGYPMDLADEALLNALITTDQDYQAKKMGYA